MGYAVLHLDKAKGADSGMSAHIERTIHPKNADQSRTHLNRELIEFPDGVKNRTQAIQHRLDTAGLKRKIGKNQVRAIRILLTATHEDMQRIELDGKLDDWCQDNVAWLRKTYGSDNVVSVVLHMDESTPHLHATVVPIVEAERRKKKSEQNVKRTYRKKAAAPRLCADDVMSRTRLKAYQDSYAALMGKYGLQRGIEGSEAQHISTHEYYRTLMAQGKEIQADVDELLKQKEQMEANLSRIKSETKTAELKSTATKAATTALNGINSFLGSNKISRLEKENQQLQANVTARDRQIERLQKDMNQQRNRYTSDIRMTERRLQGIIDTKQSTIEKIVRWFPIVSEYLRIENECFRFGFTQPQTEELMTGKPMLHTGWLRTDWKGCNVWAEKVTAQIIHETRQRLMLTIENTPICQWLRQQLQKRQEERRKEEQTARRGFHL